MTGTATRYLGICIVCQRRIKVTRGTYSGSGKGLLTLVHHGYRRPGTGSIHGDCYGVGYPPNEVSDKLAKVWQAVQTDALSRGRRKLESLKVATKLQYTAGFGSQMVLKEVSEGEPRFASVKAEQLRITQYEIESAQFEIDRMNTVIANWQPGRLITFEEDKAEAAQKKAASHQRVVVSREAKVMKKVAYYQKLIDSKFKKLKSTKKPDVAEELLRGPTGLIYTQGNAVHGLREASNWELTRERALGLLDRDAVWTEIGLMRGGVHLDPKSREYYELRDGRPIGDDELKRRQSYR